MLQPIALTLPRTLQLLRISIGIIYCWFGILKFVAGLSPAEVLAGGTIRLLSFGLLEAPVSIWLLAGWETSIGILLISGIWWKHTSRMVLLHMACTFTPLVLLPESSFTTMPYGLTLVGQYIFKNLIIVSAILVITAARKS